MGTRLMPRRRSRPKKANLRQQCCSQKGTETGATAGMPMFLQRSPVTGSKTGDRLEQTADQVTERAISNEDVAPEVAPDHSVEPLPTISGEGELVELVAFANTLQLQGRTNASFSNSFTTQNVITASATGCEGCAANQCVHVTGTLESTFNVTTTVTLPQVSDFPSLTPCQQQRVQHAITNVLAPHEQQHVAAFQAYSGTVSTPFDLTICRATFTSTIRSMHNSIEQSRRSSAQSASAALDPFNFNVDLDCSD